MTDWESKIAWQRWFHSYERSDIHKKYANDIKKENSLFIHLTLVPYLKASGELKTKPTQHSVKELRSLGIQPDIIICRSENQIPTSERK